MTTHGIEAIKLYMPPAKSSRIETNIKEEKGHEVVINREKETAADPTMTSVERYRQEWSQLLCDLDENPERKTELACQGDLKVSKFRSVYWALLLRVLNADFRTWHLQRGQQRKRYEKLKHDFVRNPHDNEAAAVPNDDDPLSQSTQSVWNQYFSDQELFGVIRQDVVRTFPGVDFFRKTIIQNAMSNILFYYAREHPYLAYRQGMHEILAPILFVMYSDHQSLLHFKEIAKTDIDETLLDVLNPEYLEADSYSLFSRLMSSIESYYRISNLAQTQSGYFAAEPENSTVVSTEVEVIGQLNSIRDKILAKEDLHLHNYLMKLDIPLHIFGIRWLRLLFGREFPLLDLLVLWDAIFADSDRFDLPNYILVAMLIRIRDKLLLSDYTTCLTFLMRYPSNVDINLILRHALHMQMPKKFDRPPNAFVYMNAPTSHDANVSNSYQKPRSSSASAAARKQPLSAVSPKLTQATTDPLQQQQQRGRSSSLGGGGGEEDAAKVERQITMMQTRNAADSAALARLKVGPETARVIMDGYAENSPELMRLELKNAQTVITVARNKLQAYLATVRNHVTKQQLQQLKTNNRNSSSTDEMTQALDGIEELCSFLDVKFMFPLHARTTTPIDQAQEANEQRKVKKPTSVDNDNMQRALARGKTPSGSPPLLVNTSTTTVYEKPDNGYRFNTARLLGHLREIELIPITADEKIVVPHSSNQVQTASIGSGGGMPILDPCQYHE